jgi:hypothetical protein
MSLQSSHPVLDKEELMFINELGWLAALAVVAIDFIPKLFS